jgi:hypothetical protein
MGDFVSLVSFLKITELGPFCELLFHGKSYLFIVAKYGLRNKLGDFFTKASGHTNSQMTIQCRVARWYIFKPKIPALIFLEGLRMKNVGIFYGHLECVTANF